MSEGVRNSEEVGVSNMETEKSKREGGLVKWERFLPRMSLRVLLVEADDSTRHIISVLLRKCTYKVASVADGLKAWEILKVRPHEIDLILTEVDLPAISGFSLLTLIMEHETCKNIPVIMMSSQDSVSTVYNCMLRGAADYLVKPIRKNELRNLWQHVWRRQSTNIGGNESDAQQKVQGTSENNTACNDSISYTTSVQRNKDHLNKGSDAQSSCSRAETDDHHTENMRDLAESREGKLFSGGRKLLNNVNIDQEDEGGGSPKDANTVTEVKNVDPEKQRRNANITSEASDDNNALVNSSREAIDFIGAFNPYQNSSYKNASTTSKFDCSPQLDLSLKRSHPSGFNLENQVTEKRHMINHSDASAFTQYTNRPLKRVHPTPASDYNQHNERGSNSYSPMSITPKSTIDKSELPLSVSLQKMFPVPVPVREIKFNKIFTSYVSSVFCAPSVQSPTPSPSSANHLEPTSQVSLFHQSNFENSNAEQSFEQLHQNVNNYTNQNKNKSELESLEDCRNISPTDQGASSRVCNGAATHHNIIGHRSFSGSYSNVDQATTAPESKNEGLSAHVGNSHRSLQREAALTKFRLKRQERCYGKKVRYESRKKLAEQRPRVKGQFVRQVQSSTNDG